MNQCPISCDQAKDVLRESAKQIDANPKTSSVFALAQVLFRGLESSDVTIEQIDKLADDAQYNLIIRRAKNFASQHQVNSSDDFWERVEHLLHQFANEGFECYKSAVERDVGGVVFTAHPTFALSPEFREEFANLVGAFAENEVKNAPPSIPSSDRDWNSRINLDEEHFDAQLAIERAGQAQLKFAQCIFNIARQRFPDHWRTLNPCMPSIASWVGYDLDGRTDIDWSKSISLRLQEKAIQLRRYRAVLQSVSNELDEQFYLDELIGQISESERFADAQSLLFQREFKSPSALAQAANLLTAPDKGNINNISDIVRILDEVISRVGDDVAARLLACRSQMNSLQLGTANIHLRVNAEQVRTVVGHDLGIDSTTSSLGRKAISTLSEKVRTCTPRQVNFLDLYSETMTARRQFILCSQILKHIDAGATIRFLIAESENPATVMGALYLARQYGVDDRLDISPLFETPEALETGGRFIERLLEEPEFVAYIKRRGRLSVQLGFSDAGRFIGQVAANMAIERIHNLIIRALSEKAPGVQLLIFNTHGESMGRGAWPGSFQQRFAHLLTPWTRGRAEAHEVTLIHEVSFQGGDGYLHFGSQPLANATFAAFYLDSHSARHDCDEDPFYQRTDLVWDFYRSLRGWHEQMFENEDYGRLLSVFSPGLPVRAGSRPKKRNGGSASPRSLRAISHNATLQQLAVPINTAAGIGSASIRESDALAKLFGAIRRMTHLLELAHRAREITSIPALRAYAEAYDPSTWIAYARQIDLEDSEVYQTAYSALRDRTVAGSISRIADELSIDLLHFDRLADQTDELPSIENRHEGRLDIHVLHAVRLALVMRAITFAASVPIFSGRHDVNVEDLVRLVADFQLDEAIKLLQKIYPQNEGTSPREAEFLEPGCSDYHSPEKGYGQIHAEIIEPLTSTQDVLHKVSLALTHAYGAYG